MNDMAHAAPPPGDGRPKNRLAQSASPYLRQHAHNPVDWHPWGDEALALARRDDRPILLSVGYSACHWCHVMERESFDDPQIAAAMNASFVCIKVDREEMPDLDHVYQLAVQLLGRSGGWPLTVFLTPDLRPFFGGTYFPPTDRHGLPGFAKVLSAVADAWAEKRADVIDQASDLAAAITRITRSVGDASSPGPDLLARACQKLAVRFDAENGGFGQKPKFPNTMPLELMLRHGLASGDVTWEMRVSAALSAMQDGGIYDHLGGGFHRYSTDEAWRVPHFEKMLYDNALLLRLYTDAARALENAGYEATARGIVAWARARMTHPEGGIFASEDADSDGEEGTFYVFSPADVRAAIPDGDRAELALAHYGIEEAGNFERSGKTVLSIQKSVARLSIERGVPPSEVSASLARATEELREAREKRTRPFRDEKVLTSWNALFVSALAEAGGAFDEPSFVAEAEAAFGYVERTLVRDTAEGVVVRRHALDGAPSGRGFLDDYAFLANAALDLYEVTGTPRYAALARRLGEAIRARFVDAEVGLVLTEAGRDDLLVRPKETHDGSVPSGASMACRALLRLGALGFTELSAVAERELSLLTGRALENPFGFGQALAELDRTVRGSVDVVLVGSREDARTRALAREVFRVYLPNRAVAWVDPGDPSSVEVCPVLAEGKAPGDAPVAYVCRGRTCSAPVATPEALRALLVGA
jgi:uncharacterized protein YyaL (SSP411 family)